MDMIGFKSKVTDSLEMKGANKTLFSVRIVVCKDALCCRCKQELMMVGRQPLIKV